MADKRRQQYKIPLEGSLGLLALGYEGLVAWRKVRHDAGQLKEMNINKQKKEKGEGAE